MIANIKTGLFLGSFNPPHNGHLQAAQDAKYLGGFDEIWIQPCLTNPARNDLMDYKHRLKMCELATEGLKGIFASDFECYIRNYEGSTYAMYKLAVSCFTNRKFTLIVGSSNAPYMPNWKNGDKLIKEIPCCVVAEADRDTIDPLGKVRKLNVDDPENWFRQYPHKLIKSHNPPTISGTHIRRLLANKYFEDVAKYVSPKVIEYLESMRS